MAVSGWPHLRWVMNKSELIDIVAKEVNLPRNKIEKAIFVLFESLVASMARGVRIEIRGLGSFEIRNYGAYTGRNPRTGESISVAAKRLPFFKAGKELKERVDGRFAGQE